jgi:glycosyltransferase involved in cell wall biosynthesis
VTGVLVAVRDPDELAGALRRYLADASLRARHGSAARARVLASFQGEAIWSAMAAEYEALLARRGGRPTPRHGGAGSERRSAT